VVGVSRRQGEPVGEPGRESPGGSRGKQGEPGETQGETGRAQTEPRGKQGTVSPGRRRLLHPPARQ